MGDKLVDVVDAQGNAYPEISAPVPERWIGTGLLPKGAKKKGRASGSTSPSSEDSGGTDATQKADASN